MKQKYIYISIIPSIPIPHYVAIKYATPWRDAGPIPISEYSPLNSDRFYNSTIGQKARIRAVRKALRLWFVCFRGSWEKNHMAKQNIKKICLVSDVRCLMPDTRFQLLDIKISINRCKTPDGSQCVGRIVTPSMSYFLHLCDRSVPYCGPGSLELGCSWTAPQ